MSIKPVSLALIGFGALAGASAFHFARANNPGPESTAAAEAVEAQPPYLWVPAQLEFALGNSL